MKKLLLSLVIWLMFFWLSFADNASDLFQKAYNAYENEDFITANQVYLELINNYPTSSYFNDAYNNFFLTYYELGRDALNEWEYEYAIEFFNSYLEYSSDDWSAQYNIGVAYYNMKNYKQAETSLLSALSNVETDSDYKLVTSLLLDTQNKLVRDWMTEIERAIKWMYNNWLTMYDNSNDFRWYDPITRQEVSKFITVFAKNVLNKNIDSNIKVSYNDTKNADNSLKDYIIQSSQLWVFKWSNGNFLPFNKLTRAQAIAVILRLTSWVASDTTQWKWYTNYYQTADWFSLIKWMWFEFNALDSVYIKREELAVLLYRYNSLLNNLQGIY